MKLSSCKSCKTYISKFEFHFYFQLYDKINTQSANRPKNPTADAVHKAKEVSFKII